MIIMIYKFGLRSTILVKGVRVGSCYSLCNLVLVFAFPSLRILLLSLICPLDLFLVLPVYAIVFHFVGSLSVVSII